MQQEYEAKVARRKAAGISDSKKYLDETIEVSERKGVSTKRSLNESVGDSMYKTYEKRVSKLPKREVGAGLRPLDSFAHGENDEVAPEAVERLAAELRARDALRYKPSQSVRKNENDDITSINEANDRYNKRLSRAYDKYSLEIRQNLERGTAL